MTGTLEATDAAKTVSRFLPDISSVEPRALAVGERVVVSRRTREELHADTRVALDRDEITALGLPDGRVRLVLRNAHMLRGISRSGKTYTRWHKYRVTMVEATAAGTWLVREGKPRTPHSSRLSWTSSTIALQQAGLNLRYLGGRTAILGALEKTAAEWLPSPVVVTDLYPLMEHYRIPVTNHVIFESDPEFRRAFLGAEDTMVLTRRLFGVTRYRRDLVKAVSLASIRGLSVAWQFRGLVPIDWIIDYLRRNPLSAENPFATAGVANMRGQLRALDQRSLRRLLREEDVLPQLIRDTAVWAKRAANTGALVTGDVRSWHDLHQRQIVAERNHRRGIDEKRLAKVHKPHPGALALEGPIDTQVVDGEPLRITMARTGAELRAWGADMANCIGGYLSQLENGATWLGALHAGDKLIGNLEIHPVTEARGPVLAQLLGKHNHPLPHPIRTAVETHLTNLGVHVPTLYWGSADQVA